MENRELEEIIKKLENDSSYEKASFGLYYRDGEDECHIKANKSGFQLFAVEMLKASIDTERLAKTEGKNQIDFGYDKDWYNGDLMIAYFKPVLENRGNIKSDEPYKDSFKVSLMKAGCILIIGLLILSLIIGIYTIFKWI